MLNEIQELNKEIRSCKNCSLWESRTKAVCGMGHHNSKLMLIAQAPGEKEDRDGTMFIGPSGKVLEELLKRAKIKREEIYMTNLIKCMLPKNRKPKQEEIQICSHYLEEEIRIINPSIITTLGYYSTKYIFQKYLIPFPSSREELKGIFGKLFVAENTKILPLGHPATILYNESLREKMIENYKKLKIIIKDCKWYPTCPMKRFYEEGLLDWKWIQNYCKGDWESCIRYQMEEKGEYHSDYMLPDGRINEKLRKKVLK